MTYRIAYEDCEEKFKELIEKHMKMNKNCMLECLEEGDSFEAHAHLGAIVGLKMLLNELNGEVEY